MNKGLKDKIIALYKEGKTYNEICDILNCSKGTISFHISDLARQKIVAKRLEENERKELLIKQIRSSNLTLDEFNTYKNFLSVRDFIKLKNEIFERVFVTKESSISEYHKSRRRKIKEELVELKGGKCQICGYKKCLRSFQFHHLDPSKKDFTISANLKRINREKVIKELDKCILVCSNCHGEIHDGITRVDTREV